MNMINNLKKIMRIQQKKIIQCSNHEDEIQWYQVRSGWLIHGLVGWLISIFTALLGYTMTHWWVVIKTKGGRYYCNQYTGSYFMLEEFDSFDDADMRGRELGNFFNNLPVNITTKYQIFPKQKKMIDVIGYMQNGDHEFRVLGNNCQDYGARFAKAFRS